MTQRTLEQQTETPGDERVISSLKELPAVTSSSTGLFFFFFFFLRQSIWAWLRVRKQQRLSQDGSQRGDAGALEQGVVQAAESAQRHPDRPGSFLRHPHLHLGGRAHVGADLPDVLLSQVEDEEVGHLSECVKLSGTWCKKNFLQTHGRVIKDRHSRHFSEP